jgi:hypothetical protein
LGERAFGNVLSRIAFMAHPLTIADDGSDFFCTLFEARDDSGKPESVQNVRTVCPDLIGIHLC